MKIWFISDTHGFHKYFHVPQADMVIHCGDEANYSDPALNAPESQKFFEWYSELSIATKVFVPGNHSTAIQAGLVDIPDNVIMLNHESAFVEDIHIFGSPYTPAYGHGWAYMRKRNRMAAVWDSVPECDILVTHGPPKGILDLTEDRDGRLVQAGCKSLRNRVHELQPKIHAFGHMHSESGIDNFGILEIPNKFRTRFINAACYNHREAQFYQGHIVEL
jgi:Icc-related predicted phosphoesterase